MKASVFGLKTGDIEEFKWARAHRHHIQLVKRKMQALSVGRRVCPLKDGFESRETIDPYNARFKAEKCNFEANTIWLWDLSL